MSCCRSYCFGLICAAALLLPVDGIAHAEVASVYGGRDGLCGHRTANGERLNCSAMTAAVLSPKQSYRWSVLKRGTCRRC